MSSKNECTILINDRTNTDTAIYDSYLLAIKVGTKSLIEIPKTFIDKKMCLEAVKVDQSALLYISSDMLDEEICLEAVKVNPYNISCIPKHLINHDMCMEASNDLYATIYIPGHMMTDAIRNKQIEVYKRDIDKYRTDFTLV